MGSYTRRRYDAKASGSAHSREAPSTAVYESGPNGRAEKVFRKTARGARADRAELRRAIGNLESGDVLIVTRLEPSAQRAGVLRA